jgi:hypothetical protein
MKHLLAFALIATSALAYAQTTPLPDAEIKGTLTDQSGSPVAGATVYAVPQFLTFDNITPRSVKTDDNGRFDFRGGFELGTYKLYARKDKDGYLDPFDRFYADSKAETPKVDLTEDHRSATVTWKLGEKAGVVAGRVLDAVSGAPTKAYLAFMDSEGNGHHVVVRDDGQYRALVPPGKDLTLMVRAVSPPSGFQRPLATLRLEPGQEIYMDISVPKP